jgi:hypothetical protein
MARTDSGVKLGTVSCFHNDEARAEGHKKSCIYKAAVHAEFFRGNDALDAVSGIGGEFCEKLRHINDWRGARVAREAKREQ